MRERAEDLSSEHRAYERLRATHPTLPARMFTDLATVSDQVFELVEQLAQPSDGNYHEGRMAVLALLNHAYKLYVGGLHALADGNVHAWSPCFRGVLESFGAIAYVRKHPHQVVAILADRGISAGKLRNAAVSKRPELAKDFDNVNRIVHPAEDAFWAAMASGAGERSVVFQFGEFTLSRDDTMKGAGALLAGLEDLTSELRELLAEDSKILVIGKIFMTAPEP